MLIFTTNEQYYQKEVGQWGLHMMKNKFDFQKWNHKTYHGLTLYHSNLASDGYRDNNEVDRQNFTLNYRFRKGKVDMHLLANHVHLKAFIPSSLDRDDYLNEPTKAAFTWGRSEGTAWGFCEFRCNNQPPSF